MSRPVILAVDDDRDVAAALRRDMRSRYRERFSVLSASSGEEALAALRELKSRGEELALTISDQRMPGISGVDLLTRTKEIYPAAGRILLTAYSDIDAVIRGINQAQLDHYLSKPWDPPEERLYPIVDDLLDTWSAERPREAAGLRLVGYQWSPRSHAMKDFLAGNLVPYQWLDLDRDAEARRLVEAREAGPDDLPALFFENGDWLANPQPAEVAEKLGITLAASHDLYDLVIVGAGPAGLAAAVYGASEGLRTLLFDRHAPGGQAGTSSRIENYLGFPTGVSGADLTRRALLQAQRLGAEFIAPIEAVGLAVDGGYKRIALAGDAEVLSKAVLVVTGMTYRELPAPGIAEHTGAGVYYGAAITEAQAFRGGRVVVVGGGNSAGQAAMYLARVAGEVQIVVRRPGLQETMSRYLIEQIEATPNIRIRPLTTLQCVDGNGRVERVSLVSTADASVTVEPVDAVFVMIGSRPHSDWLPEQVLRDGRGFVLAGRELTSADAFPRLWNSRREPLPLETTVAGVFAAGDVRAGAINRVASAVGEGAMAVRLVHEYLSLT
ncbi:MAG TPA: FAD-dependent oxidoreductase [Longimicrobiaceae bacterium]|nr:FAD-dependent oxidoreductase [Longimicrobiaceae bacterium]